MVKGKIQDLLENKVISLPLELVKPHANPISIRARQLEGNYLETANNEEMVDLMKDKRYSKVEALIKEWNGHYEGYMIRSLMKLKRRVRFKK